MFSAIFPRSPFWQFSFPPCDMEVDVCTVGFSFPLLLLLYLCGAPREKSADGEAGCLPVTHRLAPSTLSEGLNEKKGYKSADRDLLKSEHTSDLLKNQKCGQLARLNLKTAKE